jgi:hypothetical protein
VHFEPFVFQDQLNCRPYRPVVVNDKDACHYLVPQKARVGAADQSLAQLSCDSNANTSQI